MRRRPRLAPAAALLVAALSPVAAAAPAFRLTNSAPADAPPVSRVVANVLPPGAIVPPTPETPPLIFEAATSSGFDPDQLQILLGMGTSPEGEPVQALALDFGDAGFRPGGVLDFTVSLDPAFQGDLQLMLPPTATELAVARRPDAVAVETPPAITTPTPLVDSGSSSTQVDRVPEPLSLLVWSSVAGFGLLRARRRASRAEG